MQGLGFARQNLGGLGATPSRSGSADGIRLPNGNTLPGVKFRYNALATFSDSQRQWFETAEPAANRLLATAMAELGSRYDSSGVPLFSSLAAVASNVRITPLSSFTGFSGNVTVTGISNVARGADLHILGDVRDALAKVGITVESPSWTLIKPDGAGPSLPKIPTSGGVQSLLNFVSSAGANSGGNTNPPPPPDKGLNLIGLAASALGVQPSTLTILAVGAGALVALPLIVGAFRPVRIGRY